MYVDIQKTYEETDMSDFNIPIWHCLKCLKKITKPLSNAHALTEISHVPAEMSLMSQLP
jgi:hypothetical protein